METPTIDRRDRGALTERIVNEAARNCPGEWADASAVEADPVAGTLIRLFSRMAEGLLQRLNKVPDKCFIAFLDMLGIGLEAPRPARTALVFTPAKKASGDIVVPSRTQSATKNGADGAAVVFETEKDLALTQVRIVRAVSASNGWWAGHASALPEGTGDAIETLFKGTRVIPRRLYLSHEAFFGMKDATSVMIGMAFEGTVTKEALAAIEWFKPGENGENETLNPDISISGDAATFSFHNLVGVPETTLIGFEKETGSSGEWTGRWIAADFPGSESPLPAITSITASVEISKSSSPPFTPELAFFNSAPIDLGRDFQPFGEKPKFNDAFFFASSDVFSKAGATVTAQVVLSNGIAVPDSVDIFLVWEYWDGTAWADLSPLDNSTGASKFIHDGAVSFPCPEIQKSTVNGEEDYWIRVRLVRGDYGQEAAYKPDQDGVWKLDPATLKPPYLKTVSLTYTYENQKPVEPMEIVLAYDDFLFEERDAARSDCRISFDLAQTPALYLAFDRSIAGEPVTIFFPILGGEASDESSPELAWQYWNGTTWASLDAEDETARLTRTGMLRFAGKSDAAPGVCFGEEFYWIRAAVASGKYKTLPRLKSFHLNAVWADNRVTVTDEILGSSAGRPKESFQTARCPVLAGQTVLVREDGLVKEDVEAILLEEGPDAVQRLQGPDGTVIETWVRWHEVGHFSFSTSRSRHYGIDRTDGSVTFGDGVNGMIPPAGKNNVKCGWYQYGGGARGNVEAGKIVKVRTAIPSVGGVVNPIGADGGSDGEDLAGVRERGPRLIRTRDRAVTAEDMETFVRRASPRVARVKCLTVDSPLANASPGIVSMIVVPESAEEKPALAPETAEEIERYLLQRAPIGIAEAQGIRLVSPSYVRVEAVVTLEHVPVDSKKAVEERVKRRLETFLHPLTGGFDGNGWEFGRSVYASEVYQCLKGVEGLVSFGVSLKAAEQILSFSTRSMALPSEFPERSRVEFGNGTTFLLAEALPRSGDTTGFVAFGFKEGDAIRVRRADEPVAALVISDVKDDLLSCETDENVAIGVGDVVETSLTPEDQTVRSPLLQAETTSEGRVLLTVTHPSGNFRLIHRDASSDRVEGVMTNWTDPLMVYLDENGMAYSGSHRVEFK